VVATVRARQNSLVFDWWSHFYLLERLRGTVGVWTSTHESLPAARSGEVASELESLGYAAMWLPEAWSRESLTSAGLLLARHRELPSPRVSQHLGPRRRERRERGENTECRLRRPIRTGPGREPPTTRAGTARSRVRDASSRDAPVPDCDERRADVRSEGDHDYAKVIAALGPKMLELGATLADGVHPYLVTPEHTAIARQIVGDKFVGVEQAVVLGESHEVFLERAHNHLEIYTGLENYRNSWRRFGFGDEDFVRGGSPRLCEAMVVHATRRQFSRESTNTARRSGPRLHSGTRGGPGDDPL